MRSCNERNILHCLESYLYYVILVNKKIFSEKKYIRVIEILLALILVDGRVSITSKERTFVVLQLVTNVALIEYT
jgi:hypothetical protein